MGKRGGDFLLITAVEKGEQAVVLPLGDRVVFMGVALGATHGQSQPDAAGGIQPVNHGLDPELLLVGPSFSAREGVAMKTGRDLLLDAGVLQQIARQLLAGKAVEREIPVEGPDDPVPIPPGKRTNSILLVSIAVSVAREIQPVAPPPLTEMGRLQHALDQVLPGPGALVLHKPAHLRRPGQEARQVQAQAADQGIPVSLRGGRETRALHFRKDKSIDGVAGPGISIHHRRFGFLYRSQGPQPGRG